MKTRIFTSTLILIACATAMPALAGGPAHPAGPQKAPRTAVTVPALSAEAAATLLWMREEEKLARDVYVQLYQRWKKPVFSQIATSEQRHFDAVGVKIRTFGLTDPALPVAGQFTDPDLQAAYDGLTASGKLSYLQALTVGATIEDMDIRDLQDALAGTDDAALTTTYQNLLEGSKNHLRAFVKLLRGLGVDYTPEYIDELLFDAIVGG
jgi:hypothetical protein